MSILQPYVPAYRVPLFDEMDRLLASEELTLRVFHGAPRGTQAERDDARLGHWSRPLPQVAASAAGRTLHWRRTAGIARRSGVVIAELASTNLDSYWLAQRYGSKLVLWGHGAAYVTAPNRLDSWLEMWLAVHSRAVMTYTEDGARQLVAKGLNSERITVLYNSTDTTRLRAAFEALSEQEVRQFATELRLGNGPVAVYVGGLDASKRIDLLLAAARLVHARLPDFRLIIAGEGPAKSTVLAEAARVPYLRVLPYAEQRTLALLGHVGNVMAIPGRVGLIAVDAMTLGLPIVTTHGARHGPEFGYLDAPFALQSEAAAAAFGERLLTSLFGGDHLDEATANARQASQSLSTERVARAMTAVIVGVLGDAEPSMT